MRPGAHVVTSVIARSPFVSRLLSPRPTAPLADAPGQPTPTTPHFKPFVVVSALWRKPMVLMFAGAAAIHGISVALRTSGPLDLHDWGILLDSGMLLLEGVIVSQLEREHQEEAAAQALQVRTNELLEQQIALQTTQNALLATQSALLAAQTHQHLDDAEQPITQ